MLMDQVETLHVSGYWSEILCCTITTQLSDLEVKVKHKSGELRCPATALINHVAAVSKNIQHVKGTIDLC